MSLCAWFEVYSFVNMQEEFVSANSELASDALPAVTIAFSGIRRSTTRDTQISFSNHLAAIISTLK